MSHSAEIAFYQAEFQSIFIAVHILSKEVQLFQ